MQIDPDTSAGSKAPVVNAEHPWLGLLSYKEEHHDFFFGRDREVEDILGRIRDNSLTILYGQSGLGKSSLLAAGVLPRLRKAGYAPVIISRSFTEGPDRLSLLGQTLAGITHGDEDTAATLWQLFHHRATPTSPVPVLIFDQFEEVFTLGAQPQFVDEVADWLEQMADLLQNRPPRQLAERFAKDHALAEQYHFGDAPVRIVFTLREDYLANLERWKARLPLLMQNRMALTLLTGPQARQAVLGPAQIGDDSLVSREVAESIVRTVARVPRDTPLDRIKAVPPLLSLLCEQLNAARISAGSAQITGESVRDQADDILQRFYEDSFLSFPEEHRARIRALLEDPPMITEAGYRNALVRDDAEAQLTRAGVADAKAIFDTLIQRRLITAETRDQVQRLEITHDVLVPLLLRSRKERQDREAKEQAERVAAAAKAEQARLARERRRLRRVAVVMTVLAIAAIGFAAYGWWQAQVARKAETKAEGALVSAVAASQQAEEARKSAVAASQQADKARHEAVTAASNEKAANEKNLRTLHEASMADYAAAVQWFEKDGKWAEGVAHLARSLKWEPTNPLAAARLDSTMELHAAERQNWPLNVLLHEGIVMSAQFSPDGTRIVTSCWDKTARVWDAVSGKPVGEPMRHADSVNSAQFSADGTRIITASGNLIYGSAGEARIWDAASGKALSEPLHHKASVHIAQFSPDGTRIVTASDDKTAQVWDAASGKPLGKPLIHDESVNYAQFSPDGTHIITASADYTASVWDAADGEPLGVTINHEAGVNSAQFSPDGTRIVTASEDKTARVWDAVSGNLIGEPMRHEAMVFSAQFSADGMRIVTASWDKTARVWDAATGKPLGEPLRHEISVLSAAFSADGTRIVTASGDILGTNKGVALVWEADVGKPFGEPLRHENNVRCAEFSADGTRIVTASWDNTAQVWDAMSGEPRGEPMRHTNSVNTAQFSANGTRIVTASDDKTARVWDAASGEPLGEPLYHKDSVNSAQFSADGKHIITASDDKTARVWDVMSGMPLGEPLRHETPVLNAQFSPNGTRIVTVSGDILGTNKGEARIWDAVSGKPIGEPLRSEALVLSAQFSADGTRIVTANLDKTAQVWDAANGRPLGGPLRHEAIVLSAQFSADGTRIITASGDILGGNRGEARVWDAVSGKSLGEPLLHEGSVRSAQFSADGNRIVTACDDKTARVWDVRFKLHPPVPVTDWMLERAQAIAGLDFDDDGQLKAIPAERRIAVLLASPPSGDPREKLARWLALPTSERALTLISKFTCRQIAERERDFGTKAAIESALRYDPNVPLAHLMLAEFEDNAQRADFLCDHGLKLLPDDAILWSRASRSLLYQKKDDMALEAARKAVALDENQIAAHRALSYALNAAGNQMEALTASDKVLADKKATADDFGETGYFAAKLNQGDKARAIFSEGERRFPTIPDLLRYKGKALLLLHAPAEALVTLETYEAKMASSGDTMPSQDSVVALAISRWLTTDKAGAVADYKRLIEMVSGYADVDEVTKSDWPDALKQPMLKVLAETLKRHPELRPKKEKGAP